MTQIGYGLATVAHSGCGAIATYNALLSAGELVTFGEVVQYYNEHWSELFVLGYLGTPPHLVIEFFEDRGYTVITTMDMNQIDLYSQYADACILWYAFSVEKNFHGIEYNALGAHFVEYSKVGDEYVVRNTSGIDGMSNHNSPSEFMDSPETNRFCPFGIFIVK